jgi:hypothetical protein
MFDVWGLGFGSQSSLLPVISKKRSPITFKALDFSLQLLFTHLGITLKPETSNCF